jgi:SAM-dependent methyltransferase
MRAGDLSASFGRYNNASVATWSTSASKRRLRDDLLMEVILKAHFRSGRVLELGSATGQWVDRLSRFGFQAEGADVFEPFVAEMRRHGLVANLLDATSLPDEMAGKFDSVLGVGLSPQMNKAVPGATDATYRSVHKVLRPGGRAIFLASIYRNPGTIYRSKSEHIEAINKSGLFKVETIIPFQVLPSGWYRPWNSRLLFLIDRYGAMIRPNFYIYVLEKI